MSDYDLIIVGAGPGGCAAAKTAGDLGLKTLMLERSNVPGQKNMSGSVFFMPMVRQIYDGADDAEWTDTFPVLEGFSGQPIDDNGFYGRVEMHFDDNQFKDFKFVFRNEADQWFAEKATESSNVELRCGVCVRDLIFDDNDAVIGVICDDGEEIYAPVTIAADGINSMVAKRAGLFRTRFVGGKDLATGPCLAIRYVYRFPEGEGIKRSNVMRLEDGKLHQWMCEPACMGGMADKHPWVGHVYACPERDMATVTIYEWIGDMVKDGRNIHARMKWFLSLPEVAKELEGCEFENFEAHMLYFTWQDGYATKTYRDGLMVVGDAAATMNPFEAFGADAAQWAGRCAAQVAARAKKKGDYTEAVLHEYEDEWRASWIGKNEGTPMHIARAVWQSQGAFDGIKDVARGFMEGKVNCLAYDEMLLQPKMATGIMSIVSGLGGFGDLLLSPLKGVGKIGKFLSEGLEPRDDR